MIANIIDNRERRYRWKQITAIVEATEHDNGIDDSDQIESDPDSIVYDERPVISVADAIAWATALPCAVTLFLYDLGSGI
jgi:hypothetical protein